MSDHRNLLATLILSAALLALGWYFKSTLLLAFLAVLLALIMHMPSAMLMRWGVPRILAYVVGILLCLAIIIIVFLTVLPALIDGVAQIVATYPNALSRLLGYYADLRQSFSFLPEPNSLLLGDGQDAGRALMGRITSSLSSIAGTLGQTLIVFVVAIFLMTAPADYRGLVLRMLPKSSSDRASAILDMLHHGLKSWLKTLGMSISVTFGLVFGAFLLIGFPYALEIAAISAIATFIPTVGALIPIVPIIVFGFTAENPWIILLALPVYFVIQQLEGAVITPSFQRAELNILPAGILLFQIVAAQVFGVLGVLMAVPILVVVTVLMRELYCKDLMGWD